MATMGEKRYRLRVGWRDIDGGLHRRVTLRPAQARDELRALQDFRVYLRRESFRCVLLARVITELGPLRRVDPGVLERLSEEDLEVLEDAYRSMNDYAPRPDSGRADRSEQAP